MRGWLRRNAALLVWLTIFGGAVWAQSYEGRVEIVDTQRKACETAKGRDYNAAVAWSVAEAQRRLDDDVGTARAYGQAASAFWRFAARDCRKVYPDPSLLGR